jgi:hypothetical protein
VNEEPEGLVRDVHRAGEYGFVDTRKKKSGLMRSLWEHWQHDLWRGPLLPVLDSAVKWLIETDLSFLRRGVAHLLNWATGHTGYAAQAGLWFNDPVVPEHRPGEVVLRHVTERIVEVPYALAATASLRPGSRVLDLGACESKLALSLASLGFQTIALDQRPYPLTHPNLSVVTSSVEDWEPEEPLDAIFSISTLEHLGLPSYGTHRMDMDLDRRTIRRFPSWLNKQGILVLTVPFGEWSIDSFQRTYDSEHLAELLDGWVVHDYRICIQTTPYTWEMAPGKQLRNPWPDGTRAVALVCGTAERME